MKSRLCRSVLALYFFACSSFVTCSAQSILHKVSTVSLASNDLVRLDLQGRAPASQNRYFDLFPVERSIDLVQWTQIAVITRTNSAAENARFSYSIESNPHAFYRTPSNFLVSPLPPLNGLHAVGSFSRLLTDLSRTNAAPRAKYQFMITVFYPAIAPTSTLPETYWERAMIPAMTKWYAFTPDPNWFSRDYSNAPLALAERPWPILLYSPSLNSERRENLYKLLELASQGFVVASTDHQETFASAFPNGTIVEGTPVPETSIDRIRNSISNRVADVQLVLGELTRMNAEDPLWAGRLDLSRVGAFGFSIGGSTSAELCRTDPRIRAGAGMDGVFFLPQALENPLPKPFTLLRADTPEITMPDGRADDRLPVIEKMTRDGYYIQLAGTVHWSFADYPLLTTEDDFQKKVGTPRSPLLAPTRINQLSASFLVSFFRKYLLDQDDHRLDHPQSDIPEILNFVSSDALARRY